ncbi:MAG: hypothetical protein ACREA0_05965, partial [bacterium]
MVEIAPQLKINTNAQSRYDFGAYIALDGGNALTGNCHRDFLTPIETASNPPNVTGGPFHNLEDGLNPNTEGSDPGGDLCGDARAEDSITVKNLDSFTVTCTDPDNDGDLELNTCVSWDNQVSRNTTQSPTCKDVTDVIPGTPAKCDCNPLVIEGVRVQQSAFITVIKDTNPEAFPGNFHLFVKDPLAVEILFVDGGDGTTIPRTSISAGISPPPNPSVTYTVGETAGAGTTLSDFTTSISCVDTGAPIDPLSPIVANGTSTPLSVRPVDDWDCT